MSRENTVLPSIDPKADVTAGGDISQTPNAQAMPPTNSFDVS